MPNKPPDAVFLDPEAVAKYDEAPRRNVPGYASLVPMTRILLAEKMPPDGRVLVVGAGGGAELADFAQHHPGWQMHGVDPSGPMLHLAARRLGDLAARVTLQEGYVEAAPDGPFDAATCLLTFHFVPVEQRAPMAREIHRRLRPGAPFVAVHLRMEDEGDARGLWLSRYAAFLHASGVAPAQAQTASEKIRRELPILTPAQDEAVLHDAGFRDVQLFYVGFAFRGWVAYA